MSVRRKISELLQELKVLTPGALVRWNVLVAMIDILITRLKQGMDYEHCWVRPWQLKEYEIKPGMAHSTIRMLYDLSMVVPLDKLTKREVPPEVQISNKGMEIIKYEIEIWEELFKLTKGYILERPALQVLRERLYELDGLIERSDEKQTES